MLVTPNRLRNAKVKENLREWEEVAASAAGYLAMLVTSPRLRMESNTTRVARSVLD
jgi:hypothetical protein